MMKSPAMKLIAYISMWITTIVSINLGLLPILKYNFLEMLLNRLGIGMLFMPVHYVVGVAGIICLLALLMEGMKGCCVCGD